MTKEECAKALEALPKGAGFALGTEVWLTEPLLSRVNDSRVRVVIDLVPAENKQNATLETLPVNLESSAIPTA